MLQCPTQALECSAVSSPVCSTVSSAVSSAVSSVVSGTVTGTVSSTVPEREIDVSTKAHYSAQLKHWNKYNNC